MTDVRLIGFSGPDGAGKSSLLAAAAAHAASAGLPVHTIYLYGCLACRNLWVPAWLRRAAGAHGTHTPQRPGEAPRPRRRPSRLQHLHAHLDTTELGVRLRLARWRAGHRGDGPVVLLADRTPLDALVKHDLPADAPAVRRLHHHLRCFTVIALLDAPGDVLSRRDGEHTAAGLELTRSAYRRWAAAVPAVITLSTQTRAAAQLAGEVLGHAGVRGRNGTST